MSKPLSQAEIETLLASLRAAQAEAGIGPDGTPPSEAGDAPRPGAPADAADGPPDGDAGRPASSPGTPLEGSGLEPWDEAWSIAGEPLTRALAALLARAWRRSLPDAVIRREPSAKALRGPAARVIRLGVPLSQRIWFFAAGAAPDVIDLFVDEIEACVPSTLIRQVLPVRTPIADRAVLLPFTVEAGGTRAALTLALETRHLHRLAEWLSAGQARDVEPGPVAASSAQVSIGGLEVEATVYIGGGTYTLGALADLHPGAVLPLHTRVGEPAVIAIGGRVIATGEIMMAADESLSLRLVEILLGDEGRMAAPNWLEVSPVDA